MKGTILDFSVQTNTGVISGDDATRYHFLGSEWKESALPQRGMKVDFDTNNLNQAIAIYKALGAKSSSHSNTFNSENSEENYNLFDWFMKCLKNYANFNGRARPKEFWFYYLGLVLCNFISMIIDAVLGTEFLFYAITTLALTIPFLAVSARRLHDTNRSGWWYLISLTIIGIIPLIIWWAQSGDSHNNQYGEPTL